MPVSGTRATTSARSKRTPEQFAKWQAEELKFASEYHERELSKWKSDPKHEAVPDPSICHAEIDPSGEWISDGGLMGTTLSIQKKSNQEYDVDWYTWGCLSRWRLHRTATYTDGVLKLNRPVDAYCCWSTFDKLYAVQLDLTDSLLPSSIQVGTTFVFVRGKKQ
jgi:hypothetical protein